MKKNIPSILLSLFIILQPIIDTYYMHNNPSFELFGFRFTTIIRYLVLFGLGLYLICKTKMKPNRKHVFTYAIIVVIYSVLHHLNASNFQSLIPNGFQYSFVEEALYIIRFLVPIFIVYYINSFESSKSAFKKTLIIYSLTISLIVIVTNIFYEARSSYSNLIINYNFFDWFIKDISHYSAASKGIFASVSVITTLLAVTPYIYSVYYKEKKLFYLFVIFINSLALIMVGTRACTFGIILIGVAMIVMYLFFSIKEKKIKNNLGEIFGVIAITGISLIIIPFSPAYERLESIEEKNDNNNPSSINTGSINGSNNNDTLDFSEIYFLEDKSTREKKIIKYIQKNINNLGIMPDLLLNYSFKHDYEFWAKIIIEEPAISKANNRFIEQKILQRMKDVSNNKADTYLGMTYSRTSKAYNLEKDYVYQYYSLGIIGVIVLILPLILFLLFSAVKMVITKGQFNIENSSLCLGIGLILCVAYFSGDVLDNLGTSIIIGYLLGALVENVSKNKEKKIKCEQSKQ